MSTKPLFLSMKLKELTLFLIQSSKPIMKTGGILAIGEICIPLNVSLV